MGLFEDLKSIASTLREADKIPQYEQILDVQEKLLEMQKRIIELEEENLGLKKQINIQEEMLYDKNAYWKKSAEEQDGPFCSRCYDVDGKLVRIKLWDRARNIFHCPECKNSATLR